MHYATWQKLDSKDCILYDSIHMTLKKSKATVTEKRSLFATGWVWAGGWGSLMTEEREGTSEWWKCSIYWLWHCLSKFVELHIQKGEFYCVNFTPINLTFKNVNTNTIFCCGKIYIMWNLSSEPHHVALSMFTCTHVHMYNMCHVAQPSSTYVSRMFVNLFLIEG